MTVMVYIPFSNATKQNTGEQRVITCCVLTYSAAQRSIIWSTKKNRWSKETVDPTTVVLLHWTGFPFCVSHRPSWTSPSKSETEQKVWLTWLPLLLTRSSSSLFKWRINYTKISLPNTIFPTSITTSTSEGWMWLCGTFWPYSGL